MKKDLEVVKKLYARTQHIIANISYTTFKVGDTLLWADEEIIAISENILDLVQYTDLLGVERYCGYEIDWIGCDTPEAYVEDIVKCCKTGDAKIIELYIKQKDKNYRLIAKDKGKGELELI